MTQKTIIYTFILFVSLLCIFDTSSFAQKKKKFDAKNEDTRQYKNTKRTKYVLGLLPSRARRIHGVAFGIVNPCENHNFQSELTINGISIEIIGQLPNIIKQLIFPGNNPICHSHYCKTNGLAVGFSVGTGQLNGIGISPTLSHSYEVNGIFLSPIQHISQDARGFIAGLLTRTSSITGFQLGAFTKNKVLTGLQIGLFNRNRDHSFGSQIGIINHSKDFKGVQVGLININKAAKIKVFPFFSFSF